ncbi:MAG: phytoene/squalene synthase family protein [Anaerolineae bacterium]|nr:MAG: phytoene/squalene synthase family protein [Anaerolineae bacterium]
MNNTAIIGQAEQEYLHRQMNKVSRSFTLVTPAAGPPLSHYLSTAYLIFRVVDNIEDSYQSFTWQEARFAEFEELLKFPERAANILARWDKELWPGLTMDEIQLMSSQDGALLWRIYSQLPEVPRKSIEHWSTVMVEGMKKVKDAEQLPQFIKRGDVYLPSKVSDYNQYCYYVAGTVGHLSTEIVVDHHEFESEVADRLLINAEAFGRALQKTNIIKDFAEDLERNVCYLPDEWMNDVDYSPLSLQGAPYDWKYRVLDNILEELEDSTSYVIDLPHTGQGYRQASLLCLFPAYQTILQAARSKESLFTRDHMVKISRETFQQCIFDAQSLATDDPAIWKYGQDIQEKVKIALNSARP